MILEGLRDISLLERLSPRLARLHEEDKLECGIEGEVTWLSRLGL